MTHMILANGRDYTIGLDHAMPGNEPPSIETIAHSLSQINRFTGHTIRPYSVAEHSLLCAEIAAVQFNASPITQLACLMHDAHECITGDVSQPVKDVLGNAWASFELRIERHLRQHWGLTTVFTSQRDVIRACDLIALATERRDLLAWQEGRNAPWPVLDTPGRTIEAFEYRNLQDHGGKPVDFWGKNFLHTYHRLRDLVAEQNARLMATVHQP